METADHHVRLVWGDGVEDMLCHVPGVAESVDDIGVCVSRNIEQGLVASRVADLLEPVVDHLDRPNEQSDAGSESIEIAGAGSVSASHM